jgi:hypothetical protein
MPADEECIVRRKHPIVENTVPNARLSTFKNRCERLALREVIFAHPGVVEHA